MLPIYITYKIKNVTKYSLQKQFLLDLKQNTQYYQQFVYSFKESTNFSMHCERRCFLFHVWPLSDIWQIDSWSLFQPLLSDSKPCAGLTDCPTCGWIWLPGLLNRGNTLLQTSSTRIRTVQQGVFFHHYHFSLWILFQRRNRGSVNQEGVYLQGDLAVRGEAFEVYSFRRLYPETSPKEEKECPLPIFRFSPSITKDFCPTAVSMCLGFGGLSCSCHP